LREGICVSIEPDAGAVPARSNGGREDSRRTPAQSNQGFRLLRRVRIFDAVDDDGLRRLVDAASLVTTTKGQTVVARGSVGDALYVIQRGHFKVAAVKATGRQITLSVLGPAEVFGEVELVDGRARSTDVISIHPGSLVVIERDTFMRLATEYPSISWTLMSVVARRLRRLTERLEDRAFLDLERRLAKRLVETAEDIGATPEGYLMSGISVGFTQQDLADIVDASRERVNRQLAIWSREGFIAVERSRIHLLDPNAIRRVYLDDATRDA